MSNYKHARTLRAAGSRISPRPQGASQARQCSVAAPTRRSRNQKGLNVYPEAAGTEGEGLGALFGVGVQSVQKVPVGRGTDSFRGVIGQPDKVCFGVAQYNLLI